MDTLLQKQIEALDPAYRAVIASSFMGELARIFGNAHEMSRDDIQLFEAELLYFALFFYTEKEFTQILQADFGFTADDASTLVIALLQSFPAQYSTLHAQIIHFLRQESINEQVNENQSVTLQAEIAATEQAFSTIQPMRTMAHDMETSREVAEETVHTAVSQEDLLQQSKQTEPADRWNT
jgi:hypothetical protein